MRLFLTAVWIGFAGITGWNPVGALRAAEAAPHSPTTHPASQHTLESLVTEILQRNPELEFYEAEIAAARASRKSAALQPQPELGGSVGQKRSRSGNLSEAGVAWSVSLVQPFEWPGRIALRKAIANHDLDLAHLGRMRFQSALAGRARTLAFQYYAAAEKAAATAEVAERFQSLREILVQRDPAGLTPLLETRVIEATELNAHRKSVDASLASKSALLELNQLRGAAPDSPLTIAPAQLQFRPADSLSQLLALARTNNFDLKVRAVELAQQGFRVDLAKNERYPSISVGPSFSEENAGNERDRIIGLGVSLPLPFWNRNRGPIETATARRMQAEVSFRVAERDLDRQVAEAALTYETKREGLSRWRADSIPHFREAAELADRHYRLGAVPIATYVELQKQYLEAVEALLDTRRELLEAATHLEQLAGLSPPLVESQPQPSTSQP